jgi:hypothetical protein
MKNKANEDSIININDSIDLRNPIKIKVWSTEGLAEMNDSKTKEYTIEVRVHKHDPDSLRWNYVEKINDDITGVQKTIVFKDYALIYAEEGNAGLKVYQSLLNNLNNWSVGSITGLNNSIKTIPTSIIEFNKKLYATFKDENNNIYAYTSIDGFNWEEFSSLKNIELFLAPIKEKFDSSKDLKISYLKKVANDYIFTTSTDGVNEDDILYDIHKKHFDAEAIKEFPYRVTSYINYKSRNGVENAMLIGEAEKSTTISDGKSTIPIAVAWGYSEEKIKVNELDDEGKPVLDEKGNHIPKEIITSSWIALPAGSTNSYCPELENPTIIYYNSLFYLFGNKFDSIYVSQSGRDWKKTDKKFSFPHQDWNKENNGYDPIKFPEFRGRKNYSMVVDTQNHYLIFTFSKGTATFEEEVEEEDTTRATEHHSYSYDSEVWRARLNQLWFDLDPEHAGQ